MKMTNRVTLFLASFLALVGLVAAPASAQEEGSLEYMAKKANNPLSDVWLMILQNDFTRLDGDLLPGSKNFNSLKFQPVMPIPVFDGDYNLILRPVIQPVVSVPLDKDVGDLIGVSPNVIADSDRLKDISEDPFGRTTGLGDTVLLTLLGPNRDDGWVWGFGPTWLFPTASEDVLGAEKWGVGPAALVVRLGKEYGGLGIENWNIGALPQHWWTFAGDDDRSDVNMTDIQYFINWKMNKTQMIGMTPNIRIDWTKDGFEDAVQLPIGLGTIGMMKIGKIPCRWGIEAQYYVAQPDDLSADWNFKVFFAPIMLNPFK